jgi:hypothetical protein
MRRKARTILLAINELVNAGDVLDDAAVGSLERRVRRWNPAICFRNLLPALIWCHSTGSL